MSKYAVEVKWVTMFNRSPNDRSGLIFEQFRYAGLINNYKEAWFDEYLTSTFRINPPSGVNQKIWSEANAKRMKSFGIEAKSIKI